MSEEIYRVALIGTNEQKGIRNANFLQQKMPGFQIESVNSLDELGAGKYDCAVVAHYPLINGDLLINAARKITPSVMVLTPDYKNEGIDKIIVSPERLLEQSKPNQVSELVRTIENNYLIRNAA